MRLKRTVPASTGSAISFPLSHTLLLVLVTNILTAWTVNHFLQVIYSQDLAEYPAVQLEVANPVQETLTLARPVQAVIVKPVQPVEQTIQQKNVPAGISQGFSNRIYCMVPASASVQELKTGVRAFDYMLGTWGSRCDVLKIFVNDVPGLPSHYIPRKEIDGVKLFATGKPHPGEKGCPIVGINMQRSDCDRRNDNKCRNIWEKVWRSWAYVSKHDLQTADWFLKVDWDTYLFVSNLKEFLIPYNPQETWYLGHNVFHHVPGGGPVFNQGGATVFSQKTMGLMGEQLQGMQPRLGKTHTWVKGCLDRDGPQEELGIAGCLLSLNITASPMLDSERRERITPFQLHSHLRLLRKDGPDGWFWKGKPDTVRDGVECCADDLIAVHGYKNHEAVRMLDYEHFEKSYSNLRTKYKALQATIGQS